MTLVLFPDPLAASLAVLRADPGGSHFGTETPDALGDRLPGLPYVAVDLVTSDGLYPFREIALVQLTAWATSKASALQAVNRARAVLAAHDGIEIASVRPSNGPWTSKDVDTGQPIAAATLRVRLKPFVA